MPDKKLSAPTMKDIQLAIALIKARTGHNPEGGTHIDISEPFDSIVRNVDDLELVNELSKDDMITLAKMTVAEAQFINVSLTSGLPTQIKQALTRQGVTAQEVRRLDRNFMPNTSPLKTADLSNPLDAFGIKNPKGTAPLVSEIREQRGVFAKSVRDVKFAKLVPQRDLYDNAYKVQQLQAERLDQLIDYARKNVLPFNLQVSAGGKLEMQMPSMRGAVVTLYGTDAENESYMDTWKRAGDLNDFASAKRIDGYYLKDVHRLNPGLDNTLDADSKVFPPAETILKMTLGQTKRLKTKRLSARDPRGKDFHPENGQPVFDFNGLKMPAGVKLYASRVSSPSKFDDLDQTRLNDMAAKREFYDEYNSEAVYDAVTNLGLGDFNAEPLRDADGKPYFIDSLTGEKTPVEQSKSFERYIAMAKLEKETANAYVANPNHETEKAYKHALLRSGDFRALGMDLSESAKLVAGGKYARPTRDCEVLKKGEMIRVIADGKTMHIGGLRERNEYGVIHVGNRTLVPGIECDMDKDGAVYFKTYEDRVKETIAQSLSSQMSGEVDKAKLIHACDYLYTSNGSYVTELVSDQLSKKDLKERADYLSKSIRLSRGEIGNMTSLNKGFSEGDVKALESGKMSRLEYYMKHANARMLLPGFEKIVPAQETSVGKDQGLKLQLYDDEEIKDGNLVVKGERGDVTITPEDWKNDVTIVNKDGYSFSYNLSGKLDKLDYQVAPLIKRGVISPNDPADRQQMATNQYKHGNPLTNLDVAYLDLKGLTDNDSLVLTENGAKKIDILKPEMAEEFNQLMIEDQDKEKARAIMKKRNAARRLSVSTAEIEDRDVLPEDDPFRHASPGDKLSDKHGNKGVVALVIPNKEPQRSDPAYLTDSSYEAVHAAWQIAHDNPDLDVMATPDSPVSRHNAGSIKEIWENGNIRPLKGVPGTTIGTLAYYTCEAQAIEKKTSIANPETEKTRAVNYQQLMGLQELPALTGYFASHRTDDNFIKFTNDLHMLGLDIDENGTKPLDTQGMMELSAPLKLKSGVVTKKFMKQMTQKEYDAECNRILNADFRNKDNIVKDVYSLEQHNAATLVISPSGQLDDAGDDWQYNGESIPVIACIHDKEVFDKTVGREDALKLTMTNKRTGETKTQTVGLISRPPALSKANTAFGIITYAPNPLQTSKNANMSISPQDAEQFQADFDGDQMGVYSIDNDAGEDVIKDLLKCRVEVKNPATGEYFKETGLGMQASLYRQGLKLPDVDNMTDFRKIVHQAYDAPEGIGGGLDLTNRETVMNSIKTIIKSGAKGKEKDIKGDYTESGQLLEKGIEAYLDADKESVKDLNVYNRNMMLTSASKADAVMVAGNSMKQNLPYVHRYDQDKWDEYCRKHPTVMIDNEEIELPDKMPKLSVAMTNIQGPFYNGSMQAKHSYRQAESVLNVTRTGLQKCFESNKARTVDQMVNDIVKVAKGYNVLTNKKQMAADAVAIALAKSDDSFTVPNSQHVPDYADKMALLAMNKSPYIMEDLKELKTNDGLSKTIIKEGLNKRKEEQYQNTKTIQKEAKDVEDQNFIDDLFN